MDKWDEDLAAGFIVKQWAEDLAAGFVVKQWAEDLAAGFVVKQWAEDLASEFEVGQGSGNLLAEFEVGQGSGNLFAEFCILVGVEVEDFENATLVDHFQHFSGPGFRDPIYHHTGSYSWRTEDGTSDIFDLSNGQPLVAVKIQAYAKLGNPPITFELLDNDFNVVKSLEFPRINGWVLRTIEYCGPVRFLKIHCTGGQYWGVWTDNVTIRWGTQTPETRDLYGKFTSRHIASVDLVSKFFVRQGSQDLPAEFDVRHDGSQELLGIFEGQTSQDLLGVFTPRHADSEELLGIFTSRPADSAELFAEFIVRRTTSQVLPAGFDVAPFIAASENLLGKFSARHDDSTDLLGEFIIRQPGSVELYGKFSARRSSSEDLLGKFVIQYTDSTDLLGELIIRQSDSRELSAEFISRQIGSKDLPAEFLVGAGFQDLLGKLTVQHPASLELSALFLIPAIYSVTGITKDKAGNRLANCEVALFRTVPGSPPTYVFLASDTSDVNGDYSFGGLTKNKYFVRGQKDGSPNIFDTTDNELEPV